MKDRAVNEEEATALIDYARKGLRVLATSASDAPQAIVQAIDDFVRSHAGRDSAGIADVDDELDLALSIGAVWGDQLARAYGWSWALVDDDEEDRFAVVSPTRSLALYPLHFVQACLQDPGLDFTGMLIFNMIEAGSYQEQPSTYYNLTLKTVRLIS